MRLAGDTRPPRRPRGQAALFVMGIYPSRPVPMCPLDTSAVAMYELG